MAEDIPVTGPGGPPQRPTYEAAYPRYGTGYEVFPPSQARRVSWGAILAGAVVALVVQLALGTLGLAVLFGAINPATEAQPFEGMGIGTGIWLALTALLGLFFGGWTAGRLAGQPRRFDGAMHGIVAWGIVTLFSTWLATNFLTTVVGGVFNAVGSTLGLVGGGVAAVAADGQQDGGVSIGAQIEQFLKQTGDPQLQPEALREQAAEAGQAASEAAEGTAAASGDAMSAIESAFSRLAATGEAAVNEVDRQDAINVLVARTDMTEAEAAQVVDNWTNTWQNVRGDLGATASQVGEQAAVVTENVSGSIGTFLFWSFLAMMVGLAAAAFGGSLGAPKPLALGTSLPSPSGGVVREH